LHHIYKKIKINILQFEREDKKKKRRRKEGKSIKIKS